MRRLQRFLFAPELLTSVLTQDTAWEIKAGLPLDAKPINVSFDIQRNCFSVVVESGMFPPVIEGAEIPIGTPVVVRTLREVV